MRVVLRSDVDGLGKKGDLLDVADGFARNFLIPRGRAIKASDGIQAQADAMRRSRDVRDARAREAAEQVARQLVPAVIAVHARAGAGGKLFGSVTTTDIVGAVQQQTGLELDRRTLALDEPIKAVGRHEVPVKLHADVQFRIQVEVSAG